MSLKIGILNAFKYIEEKQKREFYIEEDLQEQDEDALSHK
jgi:hypothetical protein